MHQFNIFIHVIAGTLGILVGVLPFLVKKGSKRHIHYGRIFLILIGITILTAFNGILFFRDRPFLTLITLVSMYSAISGYRAIKYKEAGPGMWDLLLVVVMIIAEALFIQKIRSSNLVWNLGVIYYTVGFLSFYLVYDILRITRIIKSTRLWLLEHIVKITGAYSALFTAAAGTVLAFWEPYNQIFSAMLGSLMLISVVTLYIIKWRKTLLVKSPD